MSADGPVMDTSVWVGVGGNTVYKTCPIPSLKKGLAELIYVLTPNLAQAALVLLLLILICSHSFLSFFHPFFHFMLSLTILSHFLSLFLVLSLFPHSFCLCQMCLFMSLLCRSSLMQASSGIYDEI